MGTRERYGAPCRLSFPAALLSASPNSGWDRPAPRRGPACKLCPAARLPGACELPLAPLGRPRRPLDSRLLLNSYCLLTKLWRARPSFPLSLSLPPPPPVLPRPVTREAAGRCSRTASRSLAPLSGPVLRRRPLAVLAS